MPSTPIPNLAAAPGEEVGLAVEPEAVLLPLPLAEEVGELWEDALAENYC